MSGISGPTNGYRLLLVIQPQLPEGPSGQWDLQPQMARIEIPTRSHKHTKNESQQCKTMTLGVPGWMFRPISIDINRWIFHEINHPAIGVCGMPHLWWPGLPGDCSKAPIRSPKRSCETTAVVEGVEQGHPDVCGIWFDGDVLCTYKYIYIHYIFTYIYIKYTYLYIYNIYIHIYIQYVGNVMRI